MEYLHIENGRRVYWSAFWIIALKFSRHYRAMNPEKVDGIYLVIL